MKTALVFTVAQARLGLDITQVEEVLPLVKLVRPPELPGMMRGFVNIEGQLVPVIRLARLLRLTTDATVWNPENDISSTIIVADMNGTRIAWMAGPDVSTLRYALADVVRLPADHVLNNCASQVIARKPPEPSIVLLEPGKLLLEEERVRLRELQDREQHRLAEALH